MAEQGTDPKKKQSEEEPKKEPRVSIPDPETLRDLYDRVSFAC
jgi:hypothetical protein